MRAKFTYLLIALLLIVTSSFAGKGDPAQFEIEIASTDSTDYSYEGVIPGTTVSVPIIVNKATHKISGFDFNIIYNPVALTLLDVEPGSFLKENNWKNFEFDFWPDSMIIIDSFYMVVGIEGSIAGDSSILPPANINPGDTLAVMNFYVSSDLTLGCQSIPISFFWDNCNDNIIYSWPTEKVYYPRQVVNYDGTINDWYDSYYSSENGLDECIKPGSGRRRGFNKRAINYKNGRVQIICIQDIDDRCEYGDYNRNGIIFEVVDFVIFNHIFFSYFLDDTPSFTIDSTCLLHIADFNDDGKYLTIEDFVYFIRFFIGDDLPIDQIANLLLGGNLKIRANATKVTVNSRFESEAGAVHLCFYAPGQINNVALSDAVSHMNIRHTVSNDSLKILIYSFGGPLYDFERLSIPARLTELVSFEYTGDKPILAYASASGYYGEKVYLEIAENAQFEIQIGKLEDQYLGQHAYLPVVQTSGNAQNYGFDFLIAYNNSALAFMGAYGNSDIFDIPGEYEWEYFTYRFVNNCDNCPSGLLQIVGIADMNDGNHHSLNTILPDNTTLFTMDFMVTNDYTMEGQFIPVDFFWNDCRDNAIAAVKQGGTINDMFMAISKDVYSGIDNNVITDRLASFPTFYGAPDECLDIQSRFPPVRFIDFYNGGIRIIESESIVPRGDINLNGVLNEIADVIIFQNYLFFGLDAFTINVDKQSAATDINADGIPLTIEDYVYFAHFVLGDIFGNELPPIDQIVDEHFSGTLMIQDNGNRTTIESEFEENIGAVYLCYYAPGQINNVVLGNTVTNVGIKHTHINDTLRILVSSNYYKNLFPTNKIELLSFEYSGSKPILTHASAAGYYGEKVDLSIDYMTDSPVKSTLPEKFALYQNYPNPFNPQTEIIFSLPRSGDVTLEIFDITGRKVITLINKKLSSGLHSITWDGRDGGGNEVSSGIYLYRIGTENYSDTKKMLLLK